MAVEGSIDLTLAVNCMEHIAASHLCAISSHGEWERFIASFLLDRATCSCRYVKLL